MFIMYIPICVHVLYTYSVSDTLGIVYSLLGKDSHLPPVYRAFRCTKVATIPPEAVLPRLAAACSGVALLPVPDRGANEDDWVSS